MNTNAFFRVPIFFCMVSTTFSLQGNADTASDIRALTGAPTRIVWIQDAGPTACVYSEKPTIRLMAFDTEDTKGERALLPNIGWYAKPLLTADGNRVVFANLADHSVDVVNFDGTGLRQIVKNDEPYKTDPQTWDNDSVWTDPKSGVTWVYVKQMEQRAGQEVPTMRRYQLDHPEVSELIWDKTPVHMFMLSGDGRAASGGIGDGGNTPQGMFTLPNGNFYQRGGGCWPSMSPDGSHRMWVFTGNHRSIHFCIPTNRTGAAANHGVRFEAPGLVIQNNEEMYHPRWTNNIQFASLDSPFSHWSWKSDAKIPMDVAAKVEIYIGKFNSDFTGIERWVQVTHSTGGNYWSNVWIKPSKEAQASLTAAPELAEEKPTAPPDNKGLIYTWLNGADGNQLNDPATGAIRQCNGQFHGEARLGLYSVMDLTNGSFVPDGAADWLLAACKASNQFALETVVTPTGPASTGETIIMAFADDLENGNFVLAEKGDTLELHLKTDGTGTAGPPVPIGNLARDQANHLIISYSDNKLAFYLNGKPVTLPGTLQGGLSNWTAQPLIFGDSAKGGQNWTGLMEGIGFFSRDISAEEAHQRFLQYRARIKGRKPVETVILDAKLVGSCPAADPKGIAPYRRCLSVQLYEVGKVISGKCDDKQISVAQWSVLDEQVVPSYTKLAVGQTYRLALEKMDDHPEQESERQISGDFDANNTQLYYEVRTPDAKPVTTAASTASGPGKVDTDDVTVVTDPKPEDLTLSGTVQMAGHGSVAGATVVNAGLGYSEAPQVTFSGGGGQGAAGTAVMNVSALDVTSVGSGYTSEPTVTLSAPDLPGGRQATAKAHIDKVGGTISGLEVSDPGDGYVKAPQVTFSGGGGTGAAADATLSLASITIINSGSGYTSPPDIALDGGDGQDAAAQAALQVKAYLFTGASSNCLFTNAATLEQNGSALVFDWASPTNHNSKFGFDNTGTWVLQNAACVQFVSSSGHASWIGGDNSNSGTLNVLDHSRLGFSALQNSGILELGAGAVLGQSDFANFGANSITNTGKGVIKVINSTPDEPVTFGFVGAIQTGQRIIENGTKDGSSQAQFIIGDGKDNSTFTVMGGQDNLTNFEGSSLEINSGAMLGLLTNDNGSPHPFINRDAKITNAGDMLLAGTLRVQGNHGGFTGIENSGKLTISGNQFALERLMSSTGPSGYYGPETTSQILNQPGGVVQGIGSLNYTNSTENNKADYFRVNNLGTLAPGEAAVGQTPESFGTLLLHHSYVRFGAFAPPVKTPKPVVPPPPLQPSSPPQPGVLQIGIGGSPNATNNFDSLTLDGTDDGGTLELISGDGNTLNIVPSAGFTPHGTYRVVTATKVVGTFDTLQYNGAAQVPYTVKYAPDGIDVVFP